MQWDAAIAIAEGRFSEAAEALTESALATWDARPDAARVHRIQMGVIGMERGGYELVLPEIERLVAGDGSSVGYTWRAALAAGSRDDRSDGCRATTARADLAAGGFRGLMADHYRPVALRWLGEAVAGLRAMRRRGDAAAVPRAVRRSRARGPGGQHRRVLGRPRDRPDARSPGSSSGGRAALRAGRSARSHARVRGARRRGLAAGGPRHCGTPASVERARTMAADVVDQAERLGMVHLAESARRLARP